MDRLQDQKKKANGDDNFVQVKAEDKPQNDVFSQASWQGVSALLADHAKTCHNLGGSKESHDDAHSHQAKQIPVLGQSQTKLDLTKLDGTKTGNHSPQSMAKTLNQ